jgi:3D (Asp-Asp-Asp) domain-containing protein
MESRLKKNNAILAIAIIILFFGIVSLLQKMTLNAFKTEKEFTTAVQMAGFTVTAYCPGSCCNGAWAGLTASGKSIQYYMERGINVAAVDPAIIALGSYFLYNGTIYAAVDIGGLIKGKRIDILKDDHSRAVDFGVKRDQTISIVEMKEKISYINKKREKEIL